MSDMLTHPPIVLYVEDDEGDSFFMQRAFASAGLGSGLRVVTNGQAAIDYLSGVGVYEDRNQYPIPNFVLLDLNLPQISGFEVLQWIRQHPTFATLPVVIFSASAHDEDRVRSKALGANDYYQKPKSGLDFTKVVVALQEKWFPPPSSHLTEPNQQLRL